jgi:hypothetical protein
VYPEVALINFRSAVAADDLAREQERGRHAEEDVTEAKKPQQQPVEWWLDDLQGRTNVCGAGEIVSDLYCGQAHLYSQQIRYALDLAMSADKKGGPTARELLKTLVCLRDEANPPFVAVQDWVWDGYQQHRIPDDDAMKPTWWKELESDDDFGFGDSGDNGEKRSNRNSGGRTDGNKLGGKAKDGGEADHGSLGLDEERDNKGNSNNAANGT